MEHVCVRHSIALWTSDRVKKMFSLDALGGKNPGGHSNWTLTKLQHLKKKIKKK
jgi:hypothetical protein